jgi:hypothetical protein
MSLGNTFYDYINTNFTSTNGVFMNLNDNEVVAPYVVINLVDDPMVHNNLCKTEQGQARFQMDIYTTKVKDGYTKREALQAVVRNLSGKVVDGYSFINVQALNANDRFGAVGQLYQYSFEAYVEWEL